MDNDSCLTFTHTGYYEGSLDTVCVVLCDTLAGIEVCDTTVVIVVPPAPPVDTISIPPGDTCFDAMTYELPEVERVEICGMDPDVTIENYMDNDSCLTFTRPGYYEGSLDTVCVVLCDTLAGIEVCDTTVVILSLIHI